MNLQISNSRGPEFEIALLDFFRALAFASRRGWQAREGVAFPESPLGKFAPYLRGIDEDEAEQLHNIFSDALQERDYALGTESWLKLMAQASRDGAMRIRSAHSRHPIAVAPLV